MRVRGHGRLGGRLDAIEASQRTGQRRVRGDVRFDAWHSGHGADGVHRIQRHGGGQRDVEHLPLALVQQHLFDAQRDDPILARHASGDVVQQPGVWRGPFQVHCVHSELLGESAKHVGFGAESLRTSARPSGTCTSW